VIGPGQQAGGLTSPVPGRQAADAELRLPAVGRRAVWHVPSDRIMKTLLVKSAGPLRA